MGRPRKPDEEIKTNITIRINKKEREFLEQLAKELELTYSETIRLLIFTGGKIDVRKINK
jgi:hypothetical protein